MDPLGAKARYYDDLNQLVQNISVNTKPGDHILVMSNGGFGGIHEKILLALHDS